DVEALIALGPQEIPATLQMTDQAVCLVLGGDTDVPNAGIECVGEREVDDARLASEIDRRLGAYVGELEQARAAPTGEDVRHGRSGKLAGSGLPLDRSQFHDAPLSPPVEPDLRCRICLFGKFEWIVGGDASVRFRPRLPTRRERVPRTPIALHPRYRQ